MKKEKRSWKNIEVSGWIYGTKKESEKYQQIYADLMKAAWDIFSMTAESDGMKFKKQ